MIFIIVSSVIILDQCTKFLALKFLQLNTPVSIIKNFLNFKGPIFWEVFIDPNQKKLPKWEAGLLEEKNKI